MNVDIAERTKFDTGGLHSPPPVDSPAGKTSAISSKITSILSASYADIEIRDALETLDARGLQNTQNTRRNLRRDVQKEIIDCNGEVVLDFGKVAQELKSVGIALASLRKTCADMRQHVALARMETAPMLDEANTLLAQKAQVEAKQDILSAFNAHFVLTDAELTALTSGSEPVGDNFFQAVVKAKRIHKDCQILLGTENQRLGLEILEQSSKYLNAGFQKLYRWIQREFKSLDLENPRITTSIRRALRVLAERPTLFQNCLDSFAEARENSLMDAFYNALTGPSQNMGSQKPIEFSAHEPLRYVGDMLAWTHSATVSEREALEGLFVSEGNEIAKGIEEGLESEPWSRAESGEKFDGRKALRQLVDRSLAGVARLLQQRIDQVVQSHDEPVLAYKIANLVAFYKNIFTKLVDESGFLETLSAIETAALEQFSTAMRAHLAAIQSEQPSAPPNLAPPEFLRAALDALQPLLKSYETSLAARNAAESSLELLLTEALDPFLAYTDTLAATLPTPSSTILSINSLLEARTALSNFSFTAPKPASLAAALDAHTASLAQSQHTYLLSASGLDALLAALAPLDASSAADLARVPGLPAFASDALMAAAQRLDAFLPSAVMDATERLKGIRHGSIAQDVTNDAAGRFCLDFDVVERMLIAADEAAAQREEEERREKRGGGTEDDEDEEETPRLREMFPRTGEEIRILLS